MVKIEEGSDLRADLELSGRRRLTQSELDLILTAHERLVARMPGGKRAILRFTHLSGLDLSRRDLSGVDLSASVLEGCKLQGSKLDGANLFGCDLHQAEMTFARWLSLYFLVTSMAWA